MFTTTIERYIDAQPWSWDELYRALSRERSAGETLEIPSAWMECPVEAVGRPYLRVLPRLSCNDTHPKVTRTFRVDVSDGSHLLVDVLDGCYRLSLVPAPLPMVGWLPSKAPLPWLTLPSAILLLALSVLV